MIGHIKALLWLGTEAKNSKYQIVLFFMFESVKKFQSEIRLHIQKNDILDSNGCEL